MRTGTCTPAPCRITQRGWDGFGHQLDGKLTCIAAAAALSIEYVHVPFKRVKVRRGAKPVYWDDATELEDFMQLGRLHATWRRGMRSHSRFPAAYPWFPYTTSKYNGSLGQACSSESYGKSWFVQLQQRNVSCCAERVYSSDNCFDFFSCDADWPRLWLRVAPRLRAHYLAAPKPQPRWLTPGCTADPSTPATIVVHFRRGDSRGLMLSPRYYAAAVRRLLLALGGRSARVRVQTDGTANDTASLRSHLHDLDVVVDYRHETPLPLAFHMMVMADAFVMSRSSLSMAAALLSNGTVAFPDCWARARRPLPSWRRVGCTRRARSAWTTPAGGRPRRRRLAAVGTMNMHAVQRSPPATQTISAGSSGRRRATAM